jgi:hypothetical protein
MPVEGAALTTTSHRAETRSFVRISCRSDVNSALSVCRSVSAESGLFALPAVLVMQFVLVVN